MRAVIQCVSSASVSVDGVECGRIGRGHLILLGVGKGDTEAQADKLWSKISKMRVFEDDFGKTNLSLADIDGDIMTISQFTLYANCKKGNRPSFTDAMEPKEAERLYGYFVELTRRGISSSGHVATGMFGEMMDVSLVNRGPFTICLDTDTL